VQANYARWDTGQFVGLGNLPGVTPAVAVDKEWAVMGEAGYNVFTMINPLVRVEHLVQTGVNGQNVKTDRYGGGINWWTYGHNVNLKSLYQFVKVDGAAKGFSQVDLQWQLYFY
jgi:hypothetical protein